DGLTLFARLHERDPELPVILVTGHADVPMAVAALKDGAWDFLAKPFASEQLVVSVRRALATRQLVLENRALRAAAARAAEGDALVGEAPAMQQLRRTMRHLADASVDVLVEGEAGTGKELVATMLHRWSARRGRRFATVDCGMSHALLAGELFGQQPGPAGGGVAHDGWIVGADGGTLFLDGLDRLPLPLQASLLRVMEEREVVPLGGDRPRHVNVRFVASVTQAAERLVDRGLLRPDLFYRLSVARLFVPPLRERREDLPLLFASLMHDAAARLRRPVPELDASLRSRLLTHDWPGNVRELAHVAEHVVLALDPPIARAGGELPLPERTQRFEAEAIRAALAAHGGDVRATLAALGLPRKTFYDKVTRYAIDLRDFRRKGDGG
ncbi:MAG: sigma-54-dependent transcriptional regulator, partial [Janthinobacterium lividum]